MENISSDGKWNRTVKELETLFALLLIIAASHGFSQSKITNDEIPQKSKELPPYASATPLSQPAIFAPGCVSTGHEFGITFTPEGRELYFTRWDSLRKKSFIFISRFKSGHWQKPVVASFSGEYSDVDPFISPNGRRLYFASNRPHTDRTLKKNHDLWYVEKTDAGWGMPQYTGASINSEGKEGSPAITADGTLYFFSDRGGVWENNDIYRAQLVGGRYAEPERLGPAINSISADVSPYISPDEKMLVFYSTRSGGEGAADLYVSYRQDGQWTAAKNLGASVNSPEWEVCPSVSPDGRYLFFTRLRNIYQIDLNAAGILGR